MGRWELFLVFVILCTFVVSTVSFLPSGARWMLHRPVARVQSRAPQTILSVNNFDDDDIFGEEDEDIGDPFGLDSSEDSVNQYDDDFLREGVDEDAFGNASIFDTEQGKMNVDFLRQIPGVEFTPEEEEMRKELEKEPEILVPSYAVMYKLKSEYMTKSFEVATADHNIYCKQFARLLNSETIAMHNSKGVVVIFAGLTADDKEELSNEVDRFVANDPLIEQGIVETWNILDLDPDVEEGMPGVTSDGIVHDDYFSSSGSDDLMEGDIVNAGDGDALSGGEDNGESEDSEGQDGYEDGGGGDGDDNYSNL